MDKIINMATARRPEKFSDMIGQPFVTGLGTQLGQGKISGQGYILSGPKGTGKTTTARIIAKSLNCDNRDTSTGDPCDECPSCLMINAGHHQQVREINAAANRGIADVSHIISTATIAIPHGYRVFILDEAHMFTKDAFSVLLKPMEEPPEGVVFILATTNPESIPETILSRSPIIPLLPLNDDELRHVLQGVIDEGMEEDNESWSKVTDGDIDNAIMSASGSARQAITTLSGIVFHGVSDTVTQDAAPEVAKSMLSGNTAQTLSLVSDALKEKTSDPVTLITAVMDNLLSSLKKSSRPDLVSKMIADLSLVASQVTGSSPAVIVSARIAACVRDGEYISISDADRKQQDRHRSTEKSSEGNSPSNSSQLRKSDSVRYWTVDEALDRIMDDSRKNAITDYWWDILNDPDQSDVIIESPGKDQRGIVVLKLPTPADDDFRRSFKSALGPGHRIES